MEKIYKKRFLNKSIILIYFFLLLLSPLQLSAEIGVKKWTKECDKNNKKNCAIAIINQVSVPGSDKKQTIATVLIQLGSTTERKMDLIDGEEKTYKLKEKKKLVPVLTIKLPLNVDLKKKPLIKIDKQNILYTSFSYCNAKEGCVSSATVVKDEIINLFKSGKELSLFMAVHGSENNMQINLPLKGFTKAYKSLLK